MAFYALVVQKAEAGSLMARMFTGGPWQFKAAAALLCFAGLAALAMRLLNLAVQYGALERTFLPSAPAEGQDVADVENLLAELDAAPPSFNATYIGARLRRALEGVRQRGSAESLDDTLRSLAEDDRRLVAARSGAVRLTAVCLPLVGLAGAAAGIAAALGGLQGQSLEAALPTVLDGSGVALGGVIQAVALTIVLLFAKLGVERAEQRLLGAVDDSAERQLLGRFAAYGTEKDPNLASVQRMSEKVLATVESAAERHDAALVKSLAGASRRWEDMASTASSLLHRSIGEAVSTGLKEHAESINSGVARLNADLQTTLVRHAQILSDNIDQHTGALADALEHHSGALAISLDHYTGTLAGALEHHTAVTTETEKALVAENRRHLADVQGALGEAMLVNASRQEKLIRQSEDLLKEMQVALVEAAGTTVAQQEQLIKQSDVLLKVVDATGQIRKLEEALNSNLLSLAASHNFEQTVTSLAAAVQLLSVRLRQPAIVRNEVDLSGGETSSQAA